MVAIDVEQREGDDRLHHVELQLARRCRKRDREVEADDQEAGLVDDLRNHRVHLAGMIELPGCICAG